MEAQIRESLLRGREIVSEIIESQGNIVGMIETIEMIEIIEMIGIIEMTGIIEMIETIETTGTIETLEMIGGHNTEIIIIDMKGITTKGTEAMIEATITETETIEMAAIGIHRITKIEILHIMGATLICKARV